MNIVMEFQKGLATNLARETYTIMVNRSRCDQTSYRRYQTNIA